MPFVNYNLEVVAKLIRKHQFTATFRNRIATLSHPDLIVDPAVLRGLAGEDCHGIVDRKDSVEILNWHKAHGRQSTVFDTQDYFRKAFGVEMTAFDVSEGRGGEIYVDLSNPWPDHLVGHRNKYDIVFDCISNQVFNVAQCLHNAVSLARPGGYVVHCVPVNMVNQGFWGISPTTFRDFYAEYDCKVVEHRLIVGVYDRVGEVPLDYRRMRGMPDDTMNLVVAQRVPERLPDLLRAPVMTKFKEFPDCKKPGSAP